MSNHITRFGTGLLLLGVLFAPGRAFADDVFDQWARQIPGPSHGVSFEAAPAPSVASPSTQAAKTEPASLDVEQQWLRQSPQQVPAPTLVSAPAPSQTAQRPVLPTHDYPPTSPLDPLEQYIR